MKVPERCGECVIARRGGLGRERGGPKGRAGFVIGACGGGRAPIGRGAEMGTGRGGPLLEGSEAGYKRRGGGRKPVSLNAAAAV